MKKKVIFTVGMVLLLGIIFLKFQSRRNDGIWLNTNYYSFATGHILPGRSILKLKNNKLKGYTHSVHSTVPNNSISFYTKNYIWTSAKWYDLISLKKIPLKYSDSLSIKMKKGEENIFKKVHDSLKNKDSFEPNFKKKAFDFTTVDNKGKLFFDEEDFFIKSEFNEWEWHTDGWEIIQTEGFDFIVFANATPLIVKKYDDVLKLYQFGIGNSLVEIKLSESSLDSLELVQIKQLKDCNN